MEFKRKYQAFNMSYDYNAAVNCPYGCSTKLREEQLLLHVTKCYKKNEELFGHCKYNYLHIYPNEFLSYHEQNCPSNIPMTEEDFAYKPEPTNTNINWILEDELSAKYAKYFLFETIPKYEEQRSNDESETICEPQNFDEKQDEISNSYIKTSEISEDVPQNQDERQEEILNSQIKGSEVIQEEELLIRDQGYRCSFLRFLGRFMEMLKNLW